MKKTDIFRSTFESSITPAEAEMKKAHTISNIMKRAEQGEEEENKGRS